MLSSSGREHQTVHVLVHVYSYKNKSLHVLLLLNFFITDHVSATRALASGATVTSKKRRAACP